MNLMGNKNSYKTLNPGYFMVKSCLYIKFQILILRRGYLDVSDIVIN